MKNSARKGLWAMCVCVLMHAHVALAAGSTLPAPWTNQDIGSVGLPGSATASNGVFTVKGAGADIWGSADAFQSVMQPITGDVQVVARVASIQDTNAHAKAGLMLRGVLTAGSADVILDVQPGGSIEFMLRSANGKATSWLSGSTQTSPAWLKLTRTGTTVTGFVSANGTAWTQVGTTSVALPASAFVGVVVNSHDLTQLNTSTFDNLVVTVVTAGSALSAPWSSQDVGAVGAAGSATSTNGVFTVRGAGADIWGSTDAFQSVSQALAGDVQLIARVASIQNTGRYAKAGIMLRDSIAASAAHVMLDVEPNGSIEFMTRHASGGATTWLSGAMQSAPVWLKLTRAGTTVTGYTSMNGATWTQAGTTTLPFGASPIATLVVSSHDTAQLNTATFDNVTAGALAGVALTPSAPSSPSPSAGAAGIAPSSVALSWTATAATSFDVRIGTTNPPAQVATGVVTASYSPSSLVAGASYFWQVVAKNSSGATPGPVWSFTTVAAPPSPAPPSTSAPSQYSAITDRLIRTKPPLPQLGTAGFTFTDPAFGSRILRVTDGATRPGSANYSYRVPSNAHLAAWNSTSTAFFVISNDGTSIPYTFDAQTMTAARMVPSSTGDGGMTLAFYVEPQFSLVNPNVIFGVTSGNNNRTIASFNFRTGAYTTLVDLDTLVGGLANTYVGGVMTGGIPSETLLTFFGGSSQDAHFYALFAPLNGGQTKLLNTMTSTINGVTTSTPLNFHIHATQIDKSGRYVFIYPTSGDLGAPRKASQVYLWDTVTDAITPITTAMLPGGHDAAGFGVWINQDCCTSSTWDAAQWQYRSLATPTVTNDLIPTVIIPKEIYMDDHTSWSNAQPDRAVPLISSTFRYGTNSTAWRAWDDEILGLETTNGQAGTVWRFAHHRSNIASDSDPAQPYFWYEPIANVSPDGRWVLFTSNWEKTLGTDAAEGTARQDVFLLQLQPLQ